MIAHAGCEASISVTRQVQAKPRVRSAEWKPISHAARMAIRWLS